MKPMKSMMAVMIFLCGCSLGAFGALPGEIDLGNEGKLLLESRPEEGTSAHFDRLMLIPIDPAGEQATVFESGGQKIVDLQTVDFSGSGAKDVLITMDTGGSGGYREYALLVQKDGKLVVAWEGEAFKDGQARLEDADKDGKIDLVVSHVSSDMPPKPEGTREETVFRFQDGTLVSLSAVTEDAGEATGQ